MPVMDEAPAAVRVDRWLWAARLVKTRALGAEAAKGGRVHVNGKAIKPGRDVRPGDRLEIASGPVRRAVIVRGVAQRRGPAAEAALLYEETAESLAARAAYADQRRAAARPRHDDDGGRPTKRDRRRWQRSQGRG
jgi:ribosome-associated heat shock protein Hsp15